MQSFKEEVEIASAIRGILRSYNFGPGVLRELLQNSDDSGATRQIFILDTRRYGTETILDPSLKGSQGMALLAINDSVFEDRDWKALSTIGDSSKTTDQNKIGKYGLGFRACYHVTDNPHVLSGNTLVVLDPQNEMSGDLKGGIRINNLSDETGYHDQLAPFQVIDAQDLLRSTIIRLPLRTETRAVTSRISDRPVSAADIKELFNDFIKEMDISLLFLKNIEMIELDIISDTETTVLGKVEVASSSKRFVPMQDQGINSFVLTIQTSIGLHLPNSKQWHLVHSVLDIPQTAHFLSQRLGYDVEQALKKDKLFAHVAVATPVEPATDKINGRLFTLLPLPIFTRFPVHIHAIFALMPDRQHLKNISDDGLDRLLVEWNKAVFDTFVPGAWARLLNDLSQLTPNLDIFSFFPPSSIPENDDLLYWKNTSAVLIHEIVSNGYPIWPVQTSRAMAYRTLDQVLVLDPDSHLSPDLFQVFDLVGLNVCHPPRNICASLSTSGESFLGLSPETVHEKLLGCLDGIGDLDRRQRTLLLQYLMSKGDLGCIVDLPLLPLARNSGFASYRRDDTTLVFVSSVEAALFGDFHPNLIELPDLVLDTFRTYAPNMFLSLGNLHTILCAAFRSYDLSQDQLEVDLSKVEWLVNFWDWMETLLNKKELLQRLGGFHLLPSRYSSARKITAGIAHSRGLDPSLINTLETIGVTFLHDALIDKVDRSGSFFGSRSVHPPEDVKYILDHLPPFHHTALDPDARKELREYFASILPPAIRLQPRQVEALRALHIFPIIRAEDMMVCDGPAGLNPLFIDHTQVSILPIVPQQNYIDVSSPAARVLARSIDRTYTGPMDEVSLLSFAIPHIEKQPLERLRALVERIVARLQDVASSDQNMLLLQHCHFVPVGDGTLLKRPIDVVDPESCIGKLFPHHHERLPHGKFGTGGRILALLRPYGFFQQNLSQELFDDLIRTYATETTTLEGHARMIDLLKLVDKHFEAGSNLTLPHQTHWLPLSDSRLSKPSECRDMIDTQCFDLILSVVPRTIRSRNLRRTLKWEERIPFDIILKQISAVLNNSPLDQVGYMLHIIKYLADGPIVKADLEALQETVRGKAWIPITSHKKLASTERALFSDMRWGLPFFKIHPFLSTDACMVFLEKMGCNNRPTTATLSSELRKMALSPKPPNLDLSLLFLEEICANNQLSDTERQDLFLPDRDGKLRPFAELYYHDMGRYNGWLPVGQYAAHRRIPELLHSHLLPLSALLLHQGSEEEDLDEEVGEMGEDLTTRIAGVLASYHINSATNEFIANACDAKATKFTILLDERKFPEDNILSEKMGPFQNTPALILFNDATFTPDDFKRLVRFGQSKAHHATTRSIGRFGLGALSFFHFTEVPMIVSGDHVLFLDPSNAYIKTLKKGSYCKLSLKRMRNVYDGHLHTVDGLFDFDMNQNSFQGTIIRLPLRSSSQAWASALSSQPFLASRMKQLLNKVYLPMATKSLFFTSMELIEAWRRDEQGTRTKLWSISAKREKCVVQGEFSSHGLALKIRGPYSEEQAWLISRFSSGNDILQKFDGFRTDYHFPSPELGLGASFRAKGSGAFRKQSPEKHNLFSTLPLPLETGLPMHLHGSWIPAPDRRTIHFDPPRQRIEGVPDAEYNQWLLSHLVPPLYLFAMEQYSRRVADRADSTSLLPLPPTDPISCSLFNVICKEFLPQSDRRLFRSIQGRYLTLKDSIFSYDEPLAVTNLVHHLSLDRFVLLKEFTLLDNIPKSSYRTLSAADVSHLLNLDQIWEVVHEMFALKTISVSDIDTVLYYLIKNGVPACGLPMPRQDGKLLRFPAAYQPTIYVGSSSVFPKNRFISDELQESTIEALLSDTSVPIRKLDAQGVVEMLSAKLGNMGNVELSSHDAQWVKQFLGDFPYLPVTISDISTFPLIPSIVDGTYVSIRHCKSVPTFLASINSKITPLLTKSGVLVLPGIPYALREGLKEIDSSFSTLLSCLAAASLSSRPSHPFDCLEACERETLANWLRFQIGFYNQDLDAHASTLLELPIWHAQQSASSQVKLSPASKIVMLPPSVSLKETSQFLRPGQLFAEHSPTLAILLNMEASRGLTGSQFMEQIRLPNSLRPEQVVSFKSLLEVMLRFVSPSDPRILLPREDRDLVRSGTLYDHTNPFFRSALRRKRPAPFLHEYLRDMLPQLRTSLLHEINLATFKACASAIHEESLDTELRIMADDVFQCFNSDLPAILTSCRASWAQVANLQFIPRARERRGDAAYSGFDGNPYAQPLPELVAPNKIVRREFEAIAWTQRARPARELSEALCLANPVIGVPTAEEVVAHLVVLAKEVAIDHPRNLDVFADITKTYYWLNGNPAAARSALRGRHKEPLFLNIDQRSDKWIWHPAGSLVLNTVYDDEQKGLFSVRALLYQYPALLSSAEVRVVKPAEFKDNPADYDFSHHLADLSKSFNRMRLREEGADIFLKAEDGSLFPAHRVYLAAAVPHFEYLVTGGWRESYDICPEISSSCNVFCTKSFVDFIYTGDITFEKEKMMEDHDQSLTDLLDLLGLAHRWHIPQLKARVVKLITHDLVLIGPDTWV